MGIPLALLFSLPLNLLASYGETYGASAATSAIGGQADLGPSPGANNYYAPALIPWAEGISGELSFGFVSPRFRDIQNIVTENSSNGDSIERGHVSGHYPSSNHTGLHLVFPLRAKKDALGLSLFSPIGSLLEAHSGEVYLPEYVFYRARHKRPALHLNYARILGKNISLSLGTHIGLQSTTRAHTQTSLTGAPYGSSSRAQAEVSPSLGAILGLAAVSPGGHHFYFTYQQEMKSHVSAHVSGEINDPTGLLFDITLESLIYYDPHIFRLGHMVHLGPWSSFLSLEHQLWRKYAPPTLSIRRNSGVILPSNYRFQVQAKNITVPKVGLAYKFTENLSLRAGFSFRPTPLERDWNGSGNALDSDSYLFSLGAHVPLNVGQRPLALFLSGQYRVLRSRQVVKTEGQENGRDGAKIGAPGYSVGGRVLSGTLGIRMGL